MSSKERDGLAAALFAQSAVDTDEEESGSFMNGCIILLMLLLLISSAVLWFMRPGGDGKTVEISGMVVDASEQPVQGATLMLDTHLMHSDSKGEFSAKVPKKDTTVLFVANHPSFDEPVMFNVNLDGTERTRFKFVMGGSLRDDTGELLTETPRDRSFSRSADGRQEVIWDAGWNAIKSKISESKDRNLGVQDIEVYFSGNRKYYGGVWLGGGSGHKTWFANDVRGFKAKSDEYVREGLQLRDIEVFPEGGKVKLAGVWQSGLTRQARFWTDMSWVQLLNRRTEQERQNFYLVDVEARLVSGQLKYSGVWHQGGAKTRLWRAASIAEVAAKNREFSGEGDGIIDLEIVRDSGGKKYLALWRGAAGGRQYTLDVSEDEFIRKRNENEGRKLNLVDLEIFPDGSSRRFAGIWAGGGSNSPVITRNSGRGGDLRLLE